MSKSRWGEAIASLLAERGWNQRQLAEKANLRPNTLTNLIKHGRDSDTATLSRIAAALKVDLADLFMSREQMEILRAHRDHNLDRVKQAVLKELSQSVDRVVREQLEKQNKAEADPAAKRRTTRR